MSLDWIGLSRDPEHLFVSGFPTRRRKYWIVSLRRRKNSKLDGFSRLETPTVDNHLLYEKAIQEVEYSFKFSHLVKGYQIISNLWIFTDFLLLESNISQNLLRKLLFLSKYGTGLKEVNKVGQRLYIAGAIHKNKRTQEKSKPEHNKTILV